MAQVRTEVGVDVMPLWVKRQIREALGGPIPWGDAHSAVMRHAARGLLDHWGRAQLPSGEWVLVTEPYGDQEAGARALAEWLGCELVLGEDPWWSDAVTRYEFRERKPDAS